MSRVKVRYSKRGFNAYRKSKEVTDLINSKADEIAKAAGEGYEVTQRRFRKRNIAAVYAQSTAARQDNSDNNTLLKALGRAKE